LKITKDPSIQLHLLKILYLANEFEIPTANQTRSIERTIPFDVKIESEVENYPYHKEQHRHQPPEPLNL
jgi:hypothetical protein